MINKTTLTDFFSKGKVIFATVAAIITFSITMYNQFKSTKSTEISGRVSANKDFDVPVDAIVRISSPVQAQTETDARGRFKFKLQNLQSDTFLLIVQNKKNNVVTKQNEYVNASSGRRDIEVFFDPDMRPGHVYTSYDKDDTIHQNRKQPNIKKILRGLFR